MSFVDANKTGVYVVDCIEKEEYIEKVRNGPAIEHTKNVWHLYDMLDKRKKIWKAFKEDIRPHSFERTKRSDSENQRDSSIERGRPRSDTLWRGSPKSKDSRSNHVKVTRNKFHLLDLLCMVALQRR